MVIETLWKELSNVSKLPDDDDDDNGDILTHGLNSSVCFVCKNVQGENKDTGEAVVEALPLHSSKFRPSTIEIFLQICQHCNSLKKQRQSLSLTTVSYVRETRSESRHNQDSNLLHYLSIWCDGSWRSIEEILQLESIEPVEIRSVSTVREYLAVFVLSQVLYNQRDFAELGEGESPFLFPSLDDTLKIVVMKNNAVGFYSMISQDTPSACYQSKYELNVLDTVYVRREFRRMGMASRILDDVMTTIQPAAMLGVSEPVSTGLLKVLWKYLSEREELRDRIWACSYTGGPGYRWNIYLGLVEQRRAERSSEISAQ